MFHRNHSEVSDSDGELPKPCPQMKGLLSALADDQLTGIARWYAENHIKGCPQCSATLSSLQTLRDRVRALGVPEVEMLEVDAAEQPRPKGVLTPSRRAALEDALAEVDRKLP